VDKVQYNLCREVFRRLEQAAVLDTVVLIGSWCLVAYEDYFKSVQYRLGVKTRDIDFLIPIPPKFKQKVDMDLLLKDLDFVRSYKGCSGHMQYSHKDLMLDFIVPERGRGTNKPFPVPALGIHAQPLRFMDFLADNVIKLPFAGCKVWVPHPANFALLKLLVSPRRQKPVKMENDFRQAVTVLRALIQMGEAKHLQYIYSSCPRKWRNTIIKTLQEQPQTEVIVSILEMGA